MARFFQSPKAARKSSVVIFSLPSQYTDTSNRPKGRNSGKPLVTVVPGTMHRMSIRSSSKFHQQSRIPRKNILKRLSSSSSDTNSSSATKVGTLEENPKLQPFFTEGVYSILERAPTPPAFNKSTLAAPMVKDRSFGPQRGWTTSLSID